MTTLSKDIEALRLKMIETAEEESALVDTLGQRLIEADEKIIATLQQLVVDQEHRRRNISHLLATIASRVGHLPPISRTPPPLPGQSAPARDFDVDTCIGDNPHVHDHEYIAGRLAH